VRKAYGAVTRTYEFGYLVNFCEKGREKRGFEPPVFANVQISILLPIRACTTNRMNRVVVFDQMRIDFDEPKALQQNRRLFSHRTQDSLLSSKSICRIV
jgi:hypothetical protein